MSKTLSHVLALGFQEDGWRSSALWGNQLACAFQRQPEFSYLGGTSLHFPLCGKSPRWYDRRVHYRSTIPRSKVFHLLDQSYGDSLTLARKKAEGLVVTIHDIAFWNDRNFLNGIMRKRIVAGLKVADRRIAISRQIKDEVENALGISVEAVVPPGISPEVFPYFSQSRSQSLLLNVGTLMDRKGFDRVLRFLACLPQEFRLLQLGGVPSDVHRRLVSSLSLENRVEFRSAVSLSELQSAYRTCAALVCASRYEGFCLPIVEARLSGTPVISAQNIPALDYLKNDSGVLALDFGAFDGVQGSADKKAETDRFLSFDLTPRDIHNRQFFSWDRVAAEFSQQYRKL